MIIAMDYTDDMEKKIQEYMVKKRIKSKDVFAELTWISVNTLYVCKKRGRISIRLVDNIEKATGIKFD